MPEDFHANLVDSPLRSGSNEKQKYQAVYDKQGRCYHRWNEECSAEHPGVKLDTE
jgi:hypothetical protein